jgi:hypothetical protein
MTLTVHPVAVHCVYCHLSQHVPSTEMSVMVYKEEARFSYAFTCRSCDEVNVKPLYYNAYQVLRPITPTYYVDAAPEMLEAHDGRPINHDDVLTFHEQVHVMRR